MPKNSTSKRAMRVTKFGSKFDSSPWRDSSAKTIFQALPVADQQQPEQEKIAREENL